MRSGVVWCGPAPFELFPRQKTLEILVLTEPPRIRINGIRDVGAKSKQGRRRRRGKKKGRGG